MRAIMQFVHKRADWRSVLDVDTIVSKRKKKTLVISNH